MSSKLLLKLSNLNVKFQTLKSQNAKPNVLNYEAGEVSWKLSSGLSSSYYYFSFLLLSLFSSSFFCFSFHILFLIPVFLLFLLLHAPPHLPYCSSTSSHALLFHIPLLPHCFSSLHISPLLPIAPPLLPLVISVPEPTNCTWCNMNNMNSAGLLSHFVICIRAPSHVTAPTYLANFSYSSSSFWSCFLSLSLSSCALSPDSHLSYCSSSHHLLALLHVTAYTSHLSPCSSSARLELHLRRPQKIHNNRHNHNRNLYGIGEKPANGHLWSRRRAMDEGREGGAAAGVEGRCKGRRVGDWWEVASLPLTNAN